MSSRITDAPLEILTEPTQMEVLRVTVALTWPLGATLSTVGKTRYITVTGEYVSLTSSSLKSS
jgi:hypothetical protein